MLVIFFEKVEDFRHLYFLLNSMLNFFILSVIVYVEVILTVYNKKSFGIK